MVSIVSIVITFSTWLTLTRIFLSPFIVAAIYTRLWTIACALFILASATDYFDGYFARLYNQESELGRILDPVADKIYQPALSLSSHIIGIGEPRGVGG